MAVKIVLTQIMKNESHVLNRMLDSIKGFADGICMVDTGSTDGSIEILKKWGEDNGVETYVFERAFDNFENSRNYSIAKAKEMFLGKNDGHTYYGFWLDADEMLEVDPKFSKSKCVLDLYMFNTYIGPMRYTRNEFYRLDKDFQFYGPIHEFIVYKGSEKITSGLLDGISVKVQMDGGSWKTNISEKYRKHAMVFEEYIQTNKDPRWIFYTAQSWHDSASTQDRLENEERWRRALKYYTDRVSIKDGYEEERYYSQYRIACVKKNLELPWVEVHQEALKAYSMDPTRAESIKLIIEYYFMVGEWHLAYIYTKFSMDTFHGKNPYPKKLLFVDESLYKWRFLELHSAACFYTGRHDEAKSVYMQLRKTVEESPDMFNPEDLAKIRSNEQFFK
jgi:glycosyltransferase involved in cell wall biosynthesis